MRKWLRRLRWICAGLSIALLAVVIFARFFCIAEPPELLEEPAVLKAGDPRREADGRMVFGSAWYREGDGLSLLYLEGDPFTRGYCHGRLVSARLDEMEDDLFGAARKHLSAPAFYAAYFMVLLNNRNLPDHVPAEYQLEIYGMSRAGRDRYGAYAPLYHRILNYHAAHDIAHWVWDKPVVGCTAFAVKNKGRLWVGRNFDFEAGPAFQRNRLVVCHKPQKGYAFLSVGWPGLAGAVTGINERRIYCSVNGAHSSDRGRIGTPVSLVVRELLQYSGTLDDAIARIRNARVFVTDSYLLADGKTGEAVVVEKTPDRCSVRRGTEGVLLQTNHFESELLRDDEGNLAYLEVGTSRQRHARLTELVAAHRDQMDAPIAAKILRDRRAPGGSLLALGNRGAIDACIATHSVIIDVSSGVLWVSRGPHTFGRYDALTIEHFGESVAASIPAAKEKTDGSFERLLAVRALLEQETDKPIPVLERALDLAPRDAEVLLRLADALRDAGRATDARERYRAALAAHPAFPQDRARAEAELNQ